MTKESSESDHCLRSLHLRTRSLTFRVAYTGVCNHQERGRERYWERFIVETRQFILGWSRLTRDIMPNVRNKKPFARPLLGCVVIYAGMALLGYVAKKNVDNLFLATILPLAVMAALMVWAYISLQRFING